MKNTKTAEPKLLNNGLSELQVQTARSILQQVNIKETAESVGVSVATINNVLRDKSGRVEELYRVITAAKRSIKKRKRFIKSIKA